MWDQNGGKLLNSTSHGGRRARRGLQAAESQHRRYFGTAAWSRRRVYSPVPTEVGSPNLFPGSSRSRRSYGPDPRWSSDLFVRILPMEASDPVSARDPPVTSRAAPHDHPLPTGALHGDLVSLDDYGGPVSIGGHGRTCDIRRGSAFSAVESGFTHPIRGAKKVCICPMEADVFRLPNNLPSRLVQIPLPTT